MLTVCLEKKAQYWGLLNLTEAEIDQIIFAGASPSAMRSPSDAFTVAEMRLIWRNGDHLSQAMRDWLWSAIESQERYDGRYTPYYRPDDVSPRSLA